MDISSPVTPSNMHRESPNNSLQLNTISTQRANQVVAQLLGSPRSAHSHSTTHSPVHRSPISPHNTTNTAASSTRTLLPYSTPTPVSAADPHLLIRRALPSDYFKGHIELLSQLTETGTITSTDYAERLDAMYRCGDTYSLLVIEDTLASNTSGSKGLIIGSATLITELKFVHTCGSVGHIEDVVVREGYRGKNLGACIIKALHEIAKALGCYKVMLDCKESNIEFYMKFGYKQNQNHMRMDFQ
jgi:glucosamine-phosphate N-acetyltransferase